MTAEQRLRVRQIFESALDRDPAVRAAWAEASAPDDSDVRAEVMSLLEHHSRAGSFLVDAVAPRVPELLADDAGEQAAFAAGTVLGSYTIVREVGRGGMGRVYLASDRKLARQVALKVLSPALTRDLVHRERLRREARAAAALTHPGICTVYAIEEIDGDLFIASEFVDGHTLRSEIEADRRPSAATIVATARELADALACAHRKGITHRDLKPENVMRTSDGRVKILDFGLARVDAESAGAGSTLAAVTMPGVLLGTPAYMAPEQIEGKPADARADVFAYGVVMYEFICGAHPFEAGSALARVARMLDSEARPLEQRRTDVPAGIVAVVDRCLRKRPADRYASAAEIAGDLDRDSPARSARRNLIWWRLHQLAAMALYVLAGSVAWKIKEMEGGATPLWLFVSACLLAAFAGIVRGHLLFTEWMNRPRLATERKRTDRARLVADLLIAAAMISDGVVLAPITALGGALTMALGIAIALAAVLMEPATTEAALGT
jgi:predicted Ser/Thr protein kinase